MNRLEEIKEIIPKYLGYKTGLKKTNKLFESFVKDNLIDIQKKSSKLLKSLENLKALGVFDDMEIAVKNIDEIISKIDESSKNKKPTQRKINLAYKYDLILLEKIQHLKETIKKLEQGKTENLEDSVREVMKSVYDIELFIGKRNKLFP